jgi:ubiquinone/menaquinone biosynthesis C-methylase UbiE
MSAAADWAEWLSRTRFAGMTDEERDESLRGLAATRDRVIAGAQLQHDDDVLDLGAGTGLLTFGVHDRIGDGWVFAVDPSVSALEELLRIAHEAKVSGVMYLVGDAEVIPLPDAAVDVCVTRSVLMYVADLERSAREIARVLKPGARLSCYEPINRKGTYLATTVDWSPLGEELARRVASEWTAYAASTPLLRLDDDELAAALRSAGFEDVRVELEQLEESWTVDARSVDARLDAVGAAGEPTLRDRWTRAFEPAEVEALVGHLHGLAGETLTFRRPQAWITARRP